MKNSPLIQTSRCVLKTIDENSTPILQQIFNDETTKQFLSELNDLVCNTEGLRQLLKSFSCYTEENTGFLWGINYKNELIGFIAIMDIPDNTTLFYAMHPNYRLQGLMKECIKEVVVYIIKTGLCDFIQSEVDIDNLISINILESSGFGIVGYDGNKVLFKRKFKDSVCQ